MVLSAVEDHDAVLFRAAEELVAAAFAGTFCQHLHHLTHLGCVALRRDFVLQGDELVEATYLHLLRDVIGQVLAGIGAWTLAVLEHEGRVIAHLAHQRQGQLVVLLRLAAVAHEDICRQAAVGDDTSDGCHAVQVPGAGVFPVHALQYGIRTALHGQVDMLAHIRHLGDDTQGLVAHVLRVARSEPHPHLRNSLSDALQ